MRYLPHTDQDIQEMLAVTGMDSLEDLFTVIPETFRVQAPLDLPPAMDEWSLNDHMAALAGSMGAASKARVFIGAGSYCHHIPSALSYLIGRSEFATAYTPYQPEVSQGTLQGIYEFQSMITSLLGMDIATASHYDCGTALAEALLIALRKNKQTRTVAVSSLVHPFHREIIKTYLTPAGYSMVELAHNPDGTTDFSLLDTVDVAGIAVQSPNFFGCIEDLARVKAAADAKNALCITSFTEALAYGLLKNPGSFGADLVAGEGQSLGIPQSFGGPGLGHPLVHPKADARPARPVCGKNHGHGRQTRICPDPGHTGAAHQTGKGQLEHLLEQRAERHGSGHVHGLYRPGRHA